MHRRNKRSRRTSASSGSSQVSPQCTHASCMSRARPREPRGESAHLRGALGDHGATVSPKQWVCINQKFDQSNSRDLYFRPKLIVTKGSSSNSTPPTPWCGREHPSLACGSSGGVTRTGYQRGGLVAPSGEKTTVRLPHPTDHNRPKSGSAQRANSCANRMLLIAHKSPAVESSRPSTQAPAKIGA